MKVDAFSGLTRELKDQSWWWPFGKKKTCEDLHRRANALIQERFEDCMRQNPTVQELKAERKFFLLFAKQAEGAVVCPSRMTTIDNLEKQAETLERSAEKTKELLRRYTKESSALDEVAALRQAVETVRDQAQESASTTIELLYSADHNYRGYRHEMRFLYLESQRQIQAAELILEQLQWSHFREVYEAWRELKARTPMPFEKGLIQTYRYVVRPSQWIPLTISRPKTMLASGCALAAGLYFAPIVLCTLTLSLLCAGATFSKQRGTAKKYPVLEELGLCQ